MVCVCLCASVRVCACMCRAGGADGIRGGKSTPIEARPTGRLRGCHVSAHLGPAVSGDASRASVLLGCC